MFEFQLVITEKCNLNCKYCYIDQKNEDMTKDVFRKHLEKLYSLLPNYKQAYNACFFGGEPLLNYDLIKYALPILKKDPKCKSIVLPTNGLLLNKERVDFLKSYDVNISWSFDGLWAPLEYNPATVATVRKLLDPLYSCKVMISPDRRVSLAENYKWFIEEFNIPNPDFSIVRDDIWSNHDIEKYILEITAFANQVIQYFKEGRNIAIPAPFSLYILDTLIGKKRGKRPFGCFAGYNGAGFMPDGSIYPCARFGSLRETPIIDQQFWKQTFNMVTQYCKKCELYQYCNAGCTWSQIHNGNKPLRNICKLLKITYKESFRIVDELKNNEKFKEVFQNMIKEIM